jgi:hypothetical protein
MLFVPFASRGFRKAPTGAGLSFVLREPDQIAADKIIQKLLPPAASSPRIEYPVEKKSEKEKVLSLLPFQ